MIPSLILEKIAGRFKIFYCNNCGNEVIKSYPDGKCKLRTNIVIWQDGKAFCKCEVCHAEVNIPVTLELPTGKKLKYYVLEDAKDDKKKNEDR